MELDIVGGVRSRGNTAIEQVGAIKIERGQPSLVEFAGAYCPETKLEIARSYIFGASTPSNNV
jgi:hypothetical protein